MLLCIFRFVERARPNTAIRKNFSLRMALDRRVKHFFQEREPIAAFKETNDCTFDDGLDLIKRSI